MRRGGGRKEIERERERDSEREGYREEEKGKLEKGGDATWLRSADEEGH